MYGTSANFCEKIRHLNPYDVHKMIINDYVLKKPGDTAKLKRDASKDKTDLDILKEHHKFLWENNEPSSWEETFAKKYYDKLFKEYCIGDLSFYKGNKIALRWRVEKEVISGKGQFVCGEKRCGEEEGLRTWEVNFAYKEQGEKKNALVKIRLCENCSQKLNYRTKKREIKRLSKGGRKVKRKSQTKDSSNESLKNISTDIAKDVDAESASGNTEESPWEASQPVEEKSRDEEMEEYLQDLLL